MARVQRWSTLQIHFDFYRIMATFCCLLRRAVETRLPIGGRTSAADSRDYIFIGVVVNRSKTNYCEPVLTRLYCTSTIWHRLFGTANTNPSNRDHLKAEQRPGPNGQWPRLMGPVARINV